MSNIKTALGGATTITITLASMPNNSGRESTVVDNTINLFLDAELLLKIKMGANAPQGNMYVLISSTIDATNFSTPATGADAVLTPIQFDMLGVLQPGQVLPGTGLIMLGKIMCLGLAAAGTIVQNFMSIASVFPNGNLPPKWGIVVINLTGQTLDATGGNFLASYDGTFATSV